MLNNNRLASFKDSLRGGRNAHWKGVGTNYKEEFYGNNHKRCS